MSDLENTNDELLSAYLDDELSPALRARVEERLATDPSARQLLEQLRAASQTVQGLPRESLGTAFRDSILRRAEQASRTAKIAATPSSPSPPAPSNGAAAQLHSAEPTWTLGRSRRGWVWAAMAVAAGLLIMVFQPRTEQNQGSRQVALRRAEQAASEKKEVAANASQERFATAESTPASSPAPMTPAPPSSTQQLAQMARDSALDTSGGTIPARVPDAEGKSMPPALAARDKVKSVIDASIESDHFATTDRAPVSLGFGTTAMPAAEAPADAPQMPTEAEDETSLPAGEDQLVVVRVHVSQEALQNKAFDKILGTNGIAVFPSPAEEDETKKLAAQAGQPVAGREQSADQKEAAAANTTEVILVEAPKDMIFSCMSSLNQDVQNFPGVAVDDAPATEASESLQETLPDESKSTATDTTASKAMPQQKLAEQLGLQRFNRGYVPPQNAGPTQGRGYYSFETRGAAPADRADQSGRGGFGGGQGQLADAQRANEIERSLRKDSSQASGARARRVMPEEMTEMQNRGLAESSRRAGTASSDSPPLGPMKLDGAQAQSKTALGENLEQLQVLFILSADDATNEAQPAASPAGGYKAK